MINNKKAASSDFFHIILLSRFFLSSTDVPPPIFTDAFSGRRCKLQWVEWSTTVPSTLLSSACLFIKANRIRSSIDLLAYQNLFTAKGVSFINY